MAQETLPVVYRLFFFRFVVSFICSHSGNIMCEMSKNLSVYLVGVGDHSLKCCWPIITRPRILKKKLISTENIGENNEVISSSKIRCGIIEVACS